MDARLPAVEVAFGKVDQRLLTIERVVLPAASPTFGPDATTGGGVEGTACNNNCRRVSLLMVVTGRPSWRGASANVTGETLPRASPRG